LVSFDDYVNVKNYYTHVVLILFLVWPETKEEKLDFNQPSIKMC